MRFSCEICPDMDDDEQIIIRCKEKTENIRLIESVIENILAGNSELVLYIRDTEFYIPKGDILYFETQDGKVKAHTAERIFTANYKLFELEKIMPSTFVRVSKSCILNVAKIEAINRNLPGASQVFFIGCEKRVYVSRSYFKLLKEKINEMRFTK